MCERYLESGEVVPSLYQVLTESVEGEDMAPCIQWVHHQNIQACHS